MSMTKEELIMTVGKCAGELATACERNGLTWDETITMLGLTAKVIVTKAGLVVPKTDCEEIGRRRLLEGFEQKMELKLVNSSSNLTH